MKYLEDLIKEAKSLQHSVLQIFQKDLITGDLVSKIKSVHIRGRFYLKKIDKVIYKEYSNLFSRTYTNENWTQWNNYIRTELESCIGFLMAINDLNPDEVIDKTLNKIFISHGKFTPYFYKIEAFIKALGLIPIYDINEPSQGKNINSHVTNLIGNSDFYIILATKETIRGKQNLPNHNVLIEYDRLIQAGNSNIIVLLEDDCIMPSMLQDVIYISFNSDTMDTAFIKIANELDKAGLIN